jgi:hypothetical protein
MKTTTKRRTAMTPTPRRRKPKPKPKALPGQVYGHWAEEGTRDEFFRTAVDSDAESLLKTGETIVVGVYELVGTAELRNSTTLKLSPG